LKKKYHEEGSERLKKIFENYDENGSENDTVHKGWPNELQKLPYFYSQMAMYPKLAANVWRALTGYVVDKVEVKIVHCTNLRTPGIVEVSVKIVYGGKEIVVNNVLRNMANPEVHLLDYYPNAEKITFECWNATGDKFLGEANLELWEILDEGLLHSKHFNLSPSQSKDPKKQTHVGLGGEIHISIRKISHRDEETKVVETKQEKKQESIMEKAKAKATKTMNTTTEKKEKTGEKSHVRKSMEELVDKKGESKENVKEEKRIPRKREAIMERFTSPRGRDESNKEDK